MGVHGLWRLLDATGKQVPLETLEGKVLAIDVSIWIHQVLAGYQDRFGNPKPNAHLIGLFNRICKLLYYKIKPVFVFDGGVPMLKKATIALRRKQKSMAKNKAQQMRTELINNLIKHSTVKTVLDPEKTDATKETTEVILSLQNKRNVDNMFKLPDLPSTSKAELELAEEYNSDSSDEPSPRKQSKWSGNIHNVDVSSVEFKSLPADMRYEILTDLKETRKQSSWGRLHEMPQESTHFSGFQMKRLLKRRLVQESLESSEKEMGGKTLTLEELEKLMKEQGIPMNAQNYAYRIAADNVTRVIYISDKNALKSNDVDSSSASSQNIDNKVDECVAGPSKLPSIIEDMDEYALNDWDSDDEIIDVNSFEFTRDTSSDTEPEIESNRLQIKKYSGRDIMSNPALTYMLEYSGLTEKQIHVLLEQKSKEDISKVKEKSSSHKKEHEGLITQSEECKNADMTDVTKSITIEDSTLSCEGDAKSVSHDSTDVKEATPAPELEFDATPVTTAVSKEVQAESKDTVMSSTESDSDDFIEIEDAPVPKTDASIEKCISQQNIQITFRSDEKIEDDMFADIFNTPNSESDVQTSSQSTQAVVEENTQCTGHDVPKQSLKRVHFEEASENAIDSENRLPGIENEIKQFSSIIKENDNVHSQIDAHTNAKSEVIQMRNKNSVNDAASIPKHDAEIENRPILLNKDDLLCLQSQLEDRQSELVADIGRLERQGIDISDQIRTEAQELLRIFGIPYIVAPMEAEAQCALLEQIRLTDGTITDDSDIWLFGGRCVYKNFFDNSKKVLEFRSEDIQYHLKLSRNEMIRLALLVGSDYTTGLTGIGPVTALEILAAFPSQGDDLLHGLSNFCTWIENGRSAGPGKATLRNKLQNLQIQKDCFSMYRLP
ncbi:DNA repair protein complementing XP-G cells homolog isoform X2 [Ceratina calcarata]|uniref:DNA repair protein complementing XP-G cells homolog isoform X2 n=1 Tax=Ceratina calcarata TaxID=156304 RepID=A0AAJ7WAI1_9HYME|nr:DNA repair protein complementing XP-G cells homolog isoform X2 [Ceratina calcarata]